MSDYACRDVLGPPKTKGFASGVARKIRTTEKQLSAWSYVKDCSKITSGPTLCPLPNYMNGIGHYELNWPSDSHFQSFLFTGKTCSPFFRGFSFEKRNESKSGYMGNSRRIAERDSSLKWFIHSFRTLSTFSFPWGKYQHG